MSTKKSTSSVQDVEQGRPAFGARFLTEDADVWSQNSWDHVPPPDDQGEKIAKSLSKQRSNPVSLEEKQAYNDKPAEYWDNFYKMNANNFFRNRKWLNNEFPELMDASKPGAGHVTVAEVGCGAGNSVFPLLSSNANPQLELHAYDYSSEAVKVVQSDPLYIQPPLGTIHAEVWDITSPNGPPSDITPGTVDIVILVFVLSALHPDEWGRAVSNIYTMLKPGGVVLLRDYGRYDMTQLRFKGGRLLEENFYIRGDKTRVYFFELDELSLIFTGAKPAINAITTTTTTAELDTEEAELASPDTTPSTPMMHPPPSTPQSSERDTPGPGEITYSMMAPPLDPQASPSAIDTMTIAKNAAGGLAAPSDPVFNHTQATDPHIHPNLVTSSSSGLSSLASCPPHPLFVTEQLGIDRRLLINRKRKVKMYRVWMQGRFRKL